MQDLRVELCLALQLDEAHRRPRRGFGDRLGIPLVVLLRLHVGLHVLGRHQPHIMTLLTQDTAEMVGAAAGFLRHHAGRQRSGEPDDAFPREAPPQDDATRSVQSRDAAAVLAKIDPKHRNRHRPLLSLKVTSQRSADRAEGAGHPIKLAIQNCSEAAPEKNPDRLGTSSRYWTLRTQAIGV